MEDENNIFDEGIDQIIKEEFEKFEETQAQKAKSKKKDTYLICHQIAMDFVKRVIDAPLPYHFIYTDGKVLKNIIKRLDLNIQYAEKTYIRIVIELKGILKKIEDDKHNHTELSSSIKMIELEATQYFIDYLHEIFKDVHIAGILYTVKSNLVNFDYYEYEYFRKALFSIKEDVEMRIRLRKEEKKNREEMYDPPEDDDNYGIEKDFLKKHQDLTLDRSVLFMDYLFKYLRIDSMNTEKAKVIAFLTIFSEKKIAQAFSRLEKEKLEMKEKMELSNKFSKDIEVVRKYLKQINLEKVEELMDNDLEINFE